MTAYLGLGRCCEHCGRTYYPTGITGRPRRYCSNACKQAAYRRAKEEARGRREAQRLAARRRLDFDVTKVDHAADERES